MHAYIYIHIYIDTYTDRYSLIDVPSFLRRPTAARWGDALPALAD